MLKIKTILNNQTLMIKEGKNMRFTDWLLLFGTCLYLVTWLLVI